MSPARTTNELSSETALAYCLKVVSKPQHRQEEPKEPGSRAKLETEVRVLRGPKQPELTGRALERGRPHRERALGTGRRHLQE